MEPPPATSHYPMLQAGIYRHLKVLISNQIRNSNERKLSEELKSIPVNTAKCRQHVLHAKSDARSPSTPAQAPDHQRRDPCDSQDTYQQT